MWTVPLNADGNWISQVSMCDLIYYTILKFRLIKYLEDNNILVQEQNGFRKMRSCLDHIFSLISTIENRYKRRQFTFVCFVDMQSAFDTINRVCVMEKLGNIGINGYMYNAIKNMYENVSCSVRVNGLMTERFDVELSVKKGLCAISNTL